MPDFIRDPELSRLVQELNTVPETPGNETETPAGAPPAEEDGESRLGLLLNEIVQREASDLLLVPGASPAFRIDGELQRSQAEILDGDDIAEIFRRNLRGHAAETMKEVGAVDFSLALGRGPRIQKFRVNVHRQKGMLAAAVRRLHTRVPTLAELNLPSSLADLTKAPRGLVLVCGATGAGKSSTLAALVGEINRTSARHVIAIEDPIEYEYQNDRSIIEHVEVGRDAPSFAAALRSALRQDPDVILIGEMRDLDTASTALSAAETGHLIFATLHTNDAAQAIHRVVDIFPAAHHAQIYKQLALVLNAVVSQTLLPRSDARGRVPAVELLLASPGVRNLIRNEKLQNLYNEIILGRRSGMIAMEESLANLAKNGVITVEEAIARSNHPAEIQSFMSA